MKATAFLEPWSCLSDYPDSVKPALERQLSIELNDGHTLFGIDVEAIAKRNDCDDVLFKDKKTNHVFVVHLTWNQNTESDEFPITFQYSNIHDFVNRRMNPDNEEYNV